MNQTEIKDTQIFPGSGNQLLGVNAAGTVDEYKSLSGTSHQITVNFSPGSITLSTPQNIDTTSSPTFSSTTVTNFYIGPVSSDPVSPVEGQMWYRSDLHQLILFNGTQNVIVA